MNKEIKVKIYPIDSLNTIINRISYLIKSIPELIVISDISREIITKSIETISDKNYEKKYVKNYIEVDISVRDIFSYIKNSSPNSLPNLDALKVLDVKLDRTYLLKIWLAYNKYYIKMPDSMAILRLNIEKMITELPEIIEDTDTGFVIVQEKINQRDLDDIIRELDVFRNNIENTLKRNHSKQAEILLALEEVYSQKQITGTEFEIEGISFNLWINLDIPILTIFNYIKLEKYAPFASIKDFYKIYQGYVPVDLITLDRDIILKVSNGLNFDLPKDKFIRDIIINSDNNQIRINIDYSMAEKFLNKNDFISRIFSVIDIPNNILNNLIEKKEIREEEESLSGVIYFENQWLDKYIFADLILNNYIFSLFLSSNENTKLIKKKTQIYARFLFLGDSSRKVQLTFSNKIAVDNRIFNPGTRYLRMKISKIRDKNDIYIFYNIFSRLLSLYNSLEESIVNEYRKFIPSFILQEVEKTDLKKLRLKHIAPELFTKLYTTSCPLQRLPSIITENEYNSLPDNERLIFPKNKEDGIQRYFRCENPEFKYIGLRLNNLENKDKYRGIPCCFKNPQKNNAKFNTYYSSKNVITRTQQTILLTGKTATFKGYGTLPNNLIKLFGLIDRDGEYLRKGTSRSSSSFIECILDVMGELKNYSENDRIKKSMNVRDELISWPGLPVGKQEMYDMSMEDIVSELENIDIFLDPIKYVSILEEKFNCNIFLFNDIDYGQMITGRYIQAYLRREYKPIYILVYINRGTSAEALTYPQCEIIVRKTENEILLSFSDDPMIHELQKIYEKLIEGYILSKKIINYPDIMGLLLDEGINVISQKIDSYGKTREIFIDINGKKLKINCDPIPPLPILEREFSIEFWDKNDIQILMKIISSPRIKSNNLFGTINIQGFMMVEISVEVGKNIIIEMMGVNEEKNNEIIGESLLNIFNIKKKANKYILEFFLKYFSRYLRDHEIDTITGDNIDDTILAFIKNKIKINSDIEDKIKPGVYFPKDFNDKFIIKDGDKLIITSEDYLKRLVFILKLRIKGDMINVLNFYKRETFRGIYTEISDFNLYPNQVIIMGESRVYALFRDVLRNNCIYSNTVENITMPYFFSNKLIKNGKLFLAQNIENISQGIYTYQNWVKNGFNNLGLGKIPNLNDNGFTLWNIVSNSKVNKFDVNGGDREINILGFLSEDGKKIFTILLPIF